MKRSVGFLAPLGFSYQFPQFLVEAWMEKTGKANPMAAAMLVRKLDCLFWVLTTLFFCYLWIFQSRYMPSLADANSLGFAICLVGVIGTLVAGVMCLAQEEFHSKVADEFYADLMMLALGARTVQSREESVHRTLIKDRFSRNGLADAMNGILEMAFECEWREWKQDGQRPFPPAREVYGALDRLKLVHRPFESYLNKAKPKKKPVTA